MLDAARAAHDDDGKAVASLALDHAQVDLKMAEQLEATLMSTMARVDGIGHATGSAFDHPPVDRDSSQLATSTMPVGTLNVGPVTDRDKLAGAIRSGSWHSRPLASVTPAPGDVSVPGSARHYFYDRVIPHLRRRLRLLDLIPTTTMKGRSFTYMREGGDSVGPPRWLKNQPPVST